MLLQNRLISLQRPSFFSSSPTFSIKLPIIFSFQKFFSQSPDQVQQNPNHVVSAAKTSKPAVLDTVKFIKKAFFVPPGVEPEEVREDMILPGSNIVLGPYAGHAQIKEVQFVKSSGKAKDCPKDDRPEFAMLGRSNVGKSSLINALVRMKEVALTSKKPGKTQLINHFLVNRSWYIVDLPGYGFANAPESARMDWSSFTKGYFLNRDTLVSVLLLIDASIPPQKIDLDCANWLGRNNCGNSYNSNVGAQVVFLFSLSYGLPFV
ncbi:PREDICTED: GTP-binding protein At2g22870 isoform X2 [Nelumbo nucifera]|uniref:GTP-binding protein At2g22870 isoform X2 n=1 Tax=Nelumbo nucifera TaxID=4432 RepID=A0A1U7Z395_NELNU|nr:PREDICTED: GTP-binding protein At2g22870 isoform X2 [Nelumbo nucifera]